jgi:hypothetical protein
MPIYPEIAAFGGADGAIYVGAKSFSQLALTSFRDTLSRNVGQVLQLAVQPYAVRFNSAVQASGHPANAVDIVFVVQAHNVFLTVAEPLILTFSLGVLEAGVFAAVLTEMTLTLSHIEFAVDVAAEKLVCHPAEARVNPTYVRAPAPNFNALIAQYHLEPDTVTRVEGMLLYSGLATAVTQTMSSPQTIDLKHLFPGIVFNGPVQSALSPDSKYLFVKGAQGFSRTPPSPCADPGDGVGPVRSGQITPDPNPNPGHAGDIQFGGPTPVAPPWAILGRRRQGEGDSGLYMPNAMAEALVTGPFPAFRIDISDDGFVGWKAAALVDFSGINFTPDPANGRFFVELRFRAEVYGSVRVDLGKLGKIRVTDFSVEQGGPGVNYARIGCYLVLGTKGLYLKPVLEDLHFDGFEVSLITGTLIGTPFGTWGVVIGYIFDRILGTLIGTQIPLHLDGELRNCMGKLIFPILEANYAAEIEGLFYQGHLRTLAAFYAGGAEGFLFSIGIE